MLNGDDARQAIAVLRDQGSNFDGVVSIPGDIAIGTFYDPEGNRIQFMSSAPPA